MTTKPMSNHKPYLQLSRPETSLYLEGFVKTHEIDASSGWFFSPPPEAHKVLVFSQSISRATNPPHLEEPHFHLGLSINFPELNFMGYKQPNPPPPQLPVKHTENILPVFPWRSFYFSAFPFPEGKILSCSAPSSCKLFLSNTGDSKQNCPALVSENKSKLSTDLSRPKHTKNV